MEKRHLFFTGNESTFIARYENTNLSKFPISKISLNSTA